MVDSKVLHYFTDTKFKESDLATNIANYYNLLGMLFGVAFEY